MWKIWTSAQTRVKAQERSDSFNPFASSVSLLVLEPRHWYAMEITMENGEQHHSPVWVMDVAGQKTGKGTLNLAFWHAAYPEGVRDKRYRWHVLRVRRLSARGAHHARREGSGADH